MISGKIRKYSRAKWLDRARRGEINISATEP